MKLNFSKEWLLKNLEKEDTAVISAGKFPCAEESAERHVLPSPAKKLAPLLSAFAKLVSLRRREMGFSFEKLADLARIDLEELTNIESTPGYTPEVRTVCQLAHVLRLPEQPLLELSGNLLPQDEGFVQDAVKFAARSKCMDTLTVEEKRELKEFVRKISR